MDEITELRRENRRLKAQLDLLNRKIYQVCLSHDHLCASLNRARVPLSRSDISMMQATARIMKARSEEEIETIYSEQTAKLLGASNTDSHKKSVIQKVFLLGKHENYQGLGEDLIAQIEKMIQDIDQHLKSLSPEDQKLYEQGMAADDIDDRDLPEDPMDRTDDLKPPF